MEGLRGRPRTVYREVWRVKDRIKRVEERQRLAVINKVKNKHSET